VKRTNKRRDRGEHDEMKEEKKKIERTRTTTKGRKWWQQVAVRAVAGKATLTVWQQWSEKSSKNESQKVNSSVEEYTKQHHHQ
jgi:hypothetical protein